MDIVYNLKKFLTEQQDEAAIPGLGVFYKSQTDNQGVELPAGTSTILFKEKNPRSNAFVNYLGYENNLTENEAVQWVETWVTSIISQLNSEKSCEIPELGTFKIQGTSVIFLTEYVENTKTEYGLEENPIPIMTTEKDTKKQEPTKTKKMPTKKNTPSGGLSKSALIWLIVCASVIVLAGIAVVCYKTVPSFQYFTQKTYHQLKNSTWMKAEKTEPIVLMPEATPELPAVEEISDEDTHIDDNQISSPKATSTAPISKEANKTPAGKKTPDTKAPAEKTTRPKTATPQQGSFYVVAGSFSVKGNAEKFVLEMKKEGYPAESLFDDGKNLYLVSIGKYASMKDALTFKETIRSSKDIACWVYKK